MILLDKWPAFVWLRTILELIIWHYSSILTERAYLFLLVIVLTDLTKTIISIAIHFTACHCVSKLNRFVVNSPRTAVYITNFLWCVKEFPTVNHKQKKHIRSPILHIRTKLLWDIVIWYVRKHKMGSRNSLGNWTCIIWQRTYCFPIIDTQFYCKVNAYNSNMREWV